VRRPVHAASGAEAGEPVKLTLFGWREESFRRGAPLKRLDTEFKRGSAPGRPWVTVLDPKEMDVDPGTDAHLRLELEQGTYSTFYDVALPYEPYRVYRDHWLAISVMASLGSLIAALTCLLSVRPLWILVIYRNLKIYSLVEAIELHGFGKILQVLLKITILPWFANHPRTLRAWVNANRTRAAAA